MPYEFVLTERDGPVGIVRINRPQVRNALNPQTIEELVDSLEAFDRLNADHRDAYHLIDDVKKSIFESIPEEDEEKRTLAARAFERLRERYFREDILDRHRRPDARAFDQIRQITCEVGVLPRAHGSALFTRGETQALATTTLGTKEDKQRLDLLFEEESFKRFMLHYNFPPFSVGEVKFLRGPGRVLRRLGLHWLWNRIQARERILHHAREHSQYQERCELSPR